MHQLLVHEVPTEGGEIPVPPSDDLVYLGLRIAPTWLEILDEPMQHRQSLLVLGRDCEQPARGIDKVLQDASIEFVRFASQLRSVQPSLHPALDNELVEAQPVGKLPKLAFHCPQILGARARFHMDRRHAEC